MENIAKKSYRANGFAGKTVYDDVFGNRPKYGPPTLSPRVEDYSEIFEGFHSSRGSTIPILDLPAAEDEGHDVFFDVRSSGFDYSEVFGNFDGLDFAVSYDQLFKQSKAEDDSSDDAWTPAQSESLSDESDPSGCSEKNQSLSSGDLHHPYDNTKQFNVSYHKVNTKGKEDISNGVTHVTQLDAIPGYSFIINEASPAKTVEDESSHLHINRNTDIDSGVTNGKKLRKTVSQPPYSDFGLQGHEIDPNPLARDVKSSSPGNAFISVSDISLRTRPSHLPPPSRPPPSFADRAENSSRLSSKLKASKSYVYEREADYSPPYFDVEIDASSSAAASAAAMKDAVKKAQAQLSSAKELMERKKEGLQNRTKSHLEKDIGHKGEKVSGVDRFNSSKGERERVHRISETEGNEMKDYAAEQRRKLQTTRHISSSSMIGENDAGGAGKYTEHEKEHSQFQVPHETESGVAWREATQFFEVVEEKKVKYENTLVHQSKSNDCGANGKGIGAVVEQKEYHMRTKEATVDHKCQQNGEKFKVLNHGCEQVENKGRSVAGDGSDRQEELRDKSKLAQKAGELKEKKKKTRVTSQLGESDNKLNELDKYVDDDILIEDQLKENEVIYKHKLRGINERVEHVIRIKEAPEKNGSGMERKTSFDCNEYERELKENAEQASDGKKLEEALGQSVEDKLEKEVFETQVNEREGMEAFKVLQHKEKWEEAVEREGRIKRSNEILEQEESNITLKVDLNQQENKNEQNCACEAEKNEQFSKIALEQSENTERQEKASENETSDNIPNDDCELDENEKRLKEAWEKKEKWKRSREAHESDESEKRAELLSKAEGSEGRSSEPNVGADCIYSIKEEKNCEGVGAQGSEGRSSEPNVRADCIYSIKEEKNCEGVSAQNSVHEQIKREVIDKKLNFKEGNYSIMEEQKTSDGVHLVGATNTRETYKPSVCEEHESLGMGRKTRERETEAVEEKNERREKESNSSDMAQNSSRHERIDNEKKDESLCQTATVQKSHEDDIDLGGIQCRNIKGASKIASVTENAYLSTHMHREGRKNLKGVQYAFNQKENRNVFTETQVLNEHERKLVDVLPAQEFTSETPEIEETNCCEKLILEEREKEERLKRERDVENDLLRKIEEEKEREREREKDRMAVDTATREARERAFAETRERAAVERATAEVRQRALSEARERLEKASAEARERLLADKSSAEARLKAERAAVERATAEARERAFEKAKTERASSDARERVEKSADKFSAYSRNGGFRQNSLPTDLQSHQSAGCSRDLKYSHSSVSGGLEGESAQRSKARLERYQRTAERAAKALEEKNMRDLLAHKEQAERNRLAEVLDADVKRWSSGKEGNLRALLSTLQYILGPASGWQPIPLTDVITAAAVKKAYRKATLCVHPDKLQQRGASIQQKYICEKVFDLLKEAWNKFNSEER